MRKKNEAIQNRQKGNYRPESNQEKKKTNIWSKENTGLLARMQRDMEQNEEEEKTWARSKSILERKTRIYNSLQVREVFLRSRPDLNYLAVSGLIIYFCVEKSRINSTRYLVI